MNGFFAGAGAGGGSNEGGSQNTTSGRKSRFGQVIFRLNKSKSLSAEQKSDQPSPLFYTEKQMD